MEDGLNFAGNSFQSRLIVGTGKYKDFQETKKAIEVSGAERRFLIAGHLVLGEREYDHHGLV